MQQREPQTPISLLSQDQEVNVGLIYSWKMLETVMGLSLDSDLISLRGLKNHQHSRGIMPGYLFNSVVISRLRGKVKTSISQEISY